MIAATTLSKVTHNLASAICQDIELSAEARQCLDDEMTPAALVNRLLQEALYADVINFLARALPKREAVWWACLSARSHLADDAPPEQLQALKLAETWVYQPTEENRRACGVAAHAAKFDNAMAWAAMAAFWNSGSMVAANLPAVPAQDNLCSKAVSGAVSLAAVLRQPELAQQKYLFFIEQAIDIANGGNGRVWQEP